MERIKELLVVEGRHDRQKLERLFDCDIICTNGLGVDDDTMKLIGKCAESQGVIVITDPDNPGERIRRQIMEAVPSVEHVFIKKKDAIGKRNVGVEYAGDDVLMEAVKNKVHFETGRKSLLWSEYCALGIMGNRKRREQVCDALNIGMCNNKTLFKRLNMLNVNIDRLKEILKDE